MPVLSRRQAVDISAGLLFIDRNIDLAGMRSVVEVRSLAGPREEARAWADENDLAEGRSPYVR